MIMEDERFHKEEIWTTEKRSFDYLLYHYYPFLSETTFLLKIIHYLF